MFHYVTDDSYKGAGIEKHKFRAYVFETPFLAGTVRHESESRSFSVCAEPNYTSMSVMADLRQRPQDEEITPRQKLLQEFMLSSGNFETLDAAYHSLEFRANRSHSLLSIGDYPSLDVAASAINTLDHWYREVLKRKGANKRFLVEEGNGFVLQNSADASSMAYTETMMHARNVQAFNMLQQNQNLNYKTIVGKVMPIFLHALGLKEYHLKHDTSKDGNGEVQFIIDKIGAFVFYKAEQENAPAFFERYSYTHGDYHRTFTGETKGDIVKKFIFEWLADAAKERDMVLREDFEEHLDDLADEVRGTWIKRLADRPSTIEAQPEPELPQNVVSLAQFRLS